MNELISKTNQTPIEIALHIDEHGMTTAKVLYEFLELEKKNYSRWSKSNILDNEFADEGTDYFPFVINEECGGQATTDYKLTAAFAKKLSMTARNEKGEQAREYFIKTEDRLKEVATLNSGLSPELQMFQQQAKMFQIIFDAQVKNELMLKQAEQKADKALETTQAIRSAIVEEYDNWRDDIKHKVSAIQKASNMTYSDTYNMLYSELEGRGHCDLSIRVNNGRFRLQEAGASKTKIEAFGRLDVIEAEPRLKEIFTAIIKEYAAKYAV